MVLGKLDITCRRMKLEPYLIPYTKVTQNGLKDLKTRPQTIQFLDVNKRERLHDTGFGKVFLK